MNRGIIILLLGLGASLAYGQHADEEHTHFGGEGHGGSSALFRIERNFKRVKPALLQLLDEYELSWLDGLDTPAAEFLQANLESIKRDVRDSELYFNDNVDQKDCGLATISPSERVISTPTHISRPVCKAKGVDAPEEAADVLLHESLHRHKLTEAEHDFIEEILETFWIQGYDRWTRSLNEVIDEENSDTEDSDPDEEDSWPHHPRVQYPVDLPGDDVLFAPLEYETNRSVTSWKSAHNTDRRRVYSSIRSQAQDFCRGWKHYGFVDDNWQTTQCWRNVKSEQEEVVDIARFFSSRNPASFDYLRTVTRYYNQYVCYVEVQCSEKRVRQSNRFTRYNLGANQGVPLGDGYEVAEVRSNSPAALAGIRRGDRIVRINNVLIRNSRDFAYAKGYSGGKAKVYVRRDSTGQLLLTDEMILHDKWDGSDRYPRQELDPIQVVAPYRLAINTKPGETQYGARGREIGLVVPGGPAAFIGLQVGDVITHINDERVTSVNETNRVMDGSGGQASFIFWRDGERFKVGPVTLATRVYEDDPLLEYEPNGPAPDIVPHPLDQRFAIFLTIDGDLRFTDEISDVERQMGLRHEDQIIRIQDTLVNSISDNQAVAAGLDEASAPGLIMYVQRDDVVYRTIPFPAYDYRSESYASEWQRGSLHKVWPYRLGVESENAGTRTPDGAGMQVDAVIAGSPAEALGIQEGDIIVEVNDRRSPHRDAFMAALAEEVVVVFWRDDLRYTTDQAVITPVRFDDDPIVYEGPELEEPELDVSSTPEARERREALGEFAESLLEGVTDLAASGDGLRIRGIYSNAVLNRYRISAGSTIHSVEGVEVRSRADFIRAIADSQAVDEIVLAVTRINRSERESVRIKVD